MELKYSNKRTKIVCTIGPSSWDTTVLGQMFVNGMNVARINGAFADIEELKRVASLIRSVSPDIGLMLDIKGHEVRFNKFQSAIEIKPGDKVEIGSNSTSKLYPITYPELHRDLKPGQVINVDKGAATLKVDSINDGTIFCTVVAGSLIESGKGMNFPGATLSNPSLTEIDKKQIEFVCDDRWDFISCSFIRNANDLEDVRNIMPNKNIKLIAKIEDQHGIDNIEEIILASDGIMIARGDMGSEIPIERITFVQKQIIKKCNMAAKPVITATNMLESMIDKPYPTRAEVTDVTNAILDGTDSIMTSGETSSGKYPAESIDMMSRIAVESEKHVEPQIFEDKYFKERKIAVSISNAAYEVINGLKVDVVVTFSPNDTLTQLISRSGIHSKIVALVETDQRKRQLDLTKSVFPYVFNQTYEDRDDVINGIQSFLFSNNLIKVGEKILIIGKYKVNRENKSQFTNIFEFVEG